MEFASEVASLVADAWALARYRQRLYSTGVAGSAGRRDQDWELRGRRVAAQALPDRGLELEPRQSMMTQFVVGRGGQCIPCAAAAPSILKPAARRNGALSRAAPTPRRRHRRSAALVMLGSAQAGVLATGIPLRTRTHPHQRATPPARDRDCARDTWRKTPSPRRRWTPLARFGCSRPERAVRRSRRLCAEASGRWGFGPIGGLALDCLKFQVRVRSSGEGSAKRAATLRRTNSATPAHAQL